MSVNFKILLLPGYFGCFIIFVISFLVPNKSIWSCPRTCTGDFVLISLGRPLLVCMSSRLEQAFLSHSRASLGEELGPATWPSRSSPCQRLLQIIQDNPQAAPAPQKLNVDFLTSCLVRITPVAHDDPAPLSHFFRGEEKGGKNGQVQDQEEQGGHR